LLSGDEVIARREFAADSRLVAANEAPSKCRADVESRDMGFRLELKRGTSADLLQAAEPEIVLCVARVKVGAQCGTARESVCQFLLESGAVYGVDKTFSP
jgi:hypothetical protein